MHTESFGGLLKSWRSRRRLSQIELSVDAEVSSRHISFLETGRTRPSRPMIARLAEVLDVPLAERNELLAAAGFAQAYARAPLDDETLAPVRRALTRMMERHAPYPAILFDRHWTLLDANPAGRALLTGATGGVHADGPVNMVEMLLSDDVVRARIRNWPDVARAMAARLRTESRHAGGDPVVDAFALRLERDPALADAPGAAAPDGPFLPVVIQFDKATTVSLFSTIAEIGTPLDVTLTDVRVELFFPADEASAAVLEGLAGAGEA